MKKFIDFEIVLILVIIIFAVPVYFAIMGGIYGINSFVIDENSMKLTAFIGIAAFVIVNLIMLFYNILKFILNCKDKIIYKKIIQNNEAIMELPSYGIVLASTIVYRNIRFGLLKRYLQEYFREKNIIDENNDIISDNFNRVGEFEKKFLPLLKKIDEENASEMQYEVEKELKRMQFIKQKSIMPSLYDFLKGKDDKYIDRGIEKNPRFTILTLTIFLGFLVISYILNSFINTYALFVLMPFACILFLFNIDKLMLTKKGKIERMRLLYLKKYLKNTEDLTDEERLFYNVLKN